jgi:hypothetical protein
MKDERILIVQKWIKEEKPLTGKKKKSRVSPYEIYGGTEIGFSPEYFGFPLSISSSQNCAISLKAVVCP